MSRVELDVEERRTEWVDIPFSDLYERLHQAGVVRNQTELAKILKLGRAAISYVSRKGTVPREWKTRLERAGINWQWAAFGEGGKYNSSRLLATSAIVAVSKITGSNNDTTSDTPDSSYQFPIHRQFLASQGIKPDQLGYIVQQGSSMYPSASDGDVWIVDKASTDMSIGCTYAMSIGGSLTISPRVVVDIDQINNKVTLGYTNPSMPTQTVGTEHVAVIGRCVFKMCKVF